MISFIIGFLLGALIVGGALWLNARRQTETLRYERELLRSRLRSFLALMDSGLLTANDPDARQTLVETEELIAAGAVPAPPAEYGPGVRAAPVQEVAAAPVQEDEEALPPIFARGDHAVGGDGASDRDGAHPGKR